MNQSQANRILGKRTLEKVKFAARLLQDFSPLLIPSYSLPPKRFVIFGAGRCGSTLLVNLMNSLDSVHCDNEILNSRVPFPKLYVDACASRSRSPVYGFKLLGYQIKGVQRINNPEQFLLGLDRSGYKIIVLKRRNLLRHALSNIYARQKKFHYRVWEKNKNKDKAIHIDVNEVLEWIVALDRGSKFRSHLFNNLPVLVSLTYEEDLLDNSRHQATVDKICDCLGILSTPVKTNLVKSTPLKLFELIQNYDELVEAVKASKYSHFLQSADLG